MMEIINLSHVKLEKVSSPVTCGNDGIVEAWIVIATISLHGLAQLRKRLSNHLELPLVVVLAP